MKRWLHFLLTAWWMVFGVQTSNAQYVPIPDANFVTWLQNNGYAGCISGSQLDTTCPAVLAATKINSVGSGIGDLTGIQYFDNLDSLLCYQNVLTWLPPLPSNLSYLDCHWNQLTQLPSLPDSLTYLLCYQNQLTSLPDFPASMFSVRCEINQLTSLPLFNEGLNYIRCSNNFITTIPPLPNSLSHLHFSNNSVTAFPWPCEWLNYVSCGNNLFDSIPGPLPVFLLSLEASNLGLTSLPSPLPAQLTSLSVGNNNLTSIPAFSWAFSGNSFTLICDSNQLTSLPTLPPKMWALRCQGNPGIECLPKFNEITSTDTSFFNIRGTGIICLPNYIQHSGYWPQMDTLPICEFVNPNNCPVGWNIAGQVYHDLNSNCNGFGEPGLQGLKVNLYKDGVFDQSVFSNGIGGYSFFTDFDTFTYTVDTTNLPFHVSCPAAGTYTSTVTATNQFFNYKHFALECDTGFDLTVSSVVHAGGMFFPNNTSFVTIDAGDVAMSYGSTCNTTGLGGTVKAVIEGPASIAAISAGGVIVGDTAWWDIADFSTANYFDAFFLSLVTDSFATSGETVCVNAFISSNAGVDNNVSNDTFLNCFSVVNSYDPNIKEVFPSGVQQPGDWLTYTIHFQNTGTAAAQNIVVKDTLDAGLDWSSFQLLSYSHENFTQVLQNGIVHFNFPNIDLPDSTSNEPESHGWIQYKIKTDSTITPGTTIHNTAAIYFDFNDPVITNDALVTYCLPVETQHTLDICEGDSVQVGNVWYTDEGTYTNVFTNQQGCDSVVTATVAFTPVYPGIMSTANVLSASGGVQYQWIDCNTAQPIAGATDATYTAAQNGLYAAQVTDVNGCSAQTECIAVTEVGTGDVRQAAFAVYPNPSNGVVHFDLNSHQGVLTVYNALGQTVETRMVNNANVTLTGLPHGVLTFKFVSIDGALHRGTLVVQK